MHRLIIIAGPPASRKTTILQTLRTLREGVYLDEPEVDAVESAIAADAHGRTVVVESPARPLDAFLRRPGVAVLYVWAALHDYRTREAVQAF